MGALMKYINRISRCSVLFRNGKLEHEGINGYQHVYIRNICMEPGISQDCLAKSIYVNKSSVTRQLTLLEQNGFITRTPSSKDKRVMQVFPTRKALDILPEIKRLSAEWESYITADLTEKEQSFFLSLLERMMEKAAEKVDKEVYKEEEKEDNE
ncbi:MAG: MarR family transcriptional regulator [Clostridiaceae bacterium]